MNINAVESFKGGKSHWKESSSHMVYTSWIVVFGSRCLNMGMKLPSLPTFRASQIRAISNKRAKSNAYFWMSLPSEDIHKDALGSCASKRGHQQIEACRAPHSCKGQQCRPSECQVIQHGFQPQFKSWPHYSKLSFSYPTDPHPHHSTRKALTALHRKTGSPRIWDVKIQSFLGEIWYE